VPQEKAARIPSVYSGKQSIGMQKHILRECGLHFLANILLVKSSKLNRNPRDWEFRTSTKDLPRQILQQVHKDQQEAAWFESDTMLQQT